MKTTNIYKYEIEDACARLLKLALNTDIALAAYGIFIDSLHKCIEIVNWGA